MALSDRPRTLRGAVWLPRVWHTHDAFLAIRDVASRFDHFESWPSVADYGCLEADAGVRFVLQRIKRRRGVREPYEVSVARGEVPTGEQSLHDFFNALVFARFPLAKRALHARMLALRSARPPGPRTPAEDRLAMIDEGGAIVTPAATLIFGHALYEHLVRGVTRPIRAFTMRTDVAIDDADRWLAAQLAHDPMPSDDTSCVRIGARP